MELSEAGKILNQVAREREAARLLGDAVAVALEALNSTSKAQLAYKDLQGQIKTAKDELADAKAKHHAFKEKCSKDNEKMCVEQADLLASRQAEADKELAPVLAKVADARKVYAQEIAEHEERIANLTKHEASLSASVSKLTATIEKLKAAVQNV